MTEMVRPGRIGSTFTAAGRPLLMPYLMAGFPDLDASRRVADAYVAGGADMVELGIPYSDPLADGPVIHAAATAALRAGVTTHHALELIDRLAEDVPVVVMVYANLVYARGLERFTQEIAARGASGLIVPDLPLEEAPEARAACQAADLDLVPLVAPTTPEDRMRTIGRLAGGFLYTVSVTGTTGERAGHGASLGDVVARAKAATEVPVAVGFGISTPADVSAAAAAGADGVIVGTRLVRAAGDGEDVRSLVAALSAALTQ